MMVLYVNGRFSLHDARINGTRFFMQHVDQHNFRDQSPSACYWLVPDGFWAVMHDAG